MAWLAAPAPTNMARMALAILLAIAGTACGDGDEGAVSDTRAAPPDDVAEPPDTLTPDTPAPDDSATDTGGDAQDTGDTAASGLTLFRA